MSSTPAGPSLRFVPTSFDAETHQPIKRARTGRGRQGQHTTNELEKSREVKQAGGQCTRCKELKKKVSDQMDARVIYDHNDHEFIIHAFAILTEARIQFLVLSSYCIR